MICCWPSALTKALESIGWSGKQSQEEWEPVQQCREGRNQTWRQRGPTSHPRPTGIACLVGRWEWEGEDGAGRVKALGKAGTGWMVGLGPRGTLASGRGGS